MEELVEADEMANTFVLRELGGIVSYLDDGTFVALDLGIDETVVHETVEHLLYQAQLVRYKRIVTDELVTVPVGVVGGRQLELGLQGVLLVVVHLAQFLLARPVLFKDTLLGDILGLRSLEAHADLESAHNLADCLGHVVHLAGFHDFVQFLLGGTRHPHLVFAGGMQAFHDALQLQKEVLAVVDELGNFIHKEYQTVVLVLRIQVGSKLVGKCLHAQEDAIVFHLLADDVGGKRREHFLALLHHKVKLVDGQVARLGIPVESFLADFFLELAKLATGIQGLLEMLGQGKVELVVAPEMVELVPENVEEHLVRIALVIAHLADVEEDGIDRGLLQPLAKVLHLGRGNIELALGVRQRVELVDALLQAFQGRITVLGVKAVVQVLQEM